MTLDLSVVDQTENPLWDDVVGRIPEINIYLCRAWGEYKKRIGRDVVRATVRGSDGLDYAHVQYQISRFAIGRFILVQGGPALTSVGKTKAHKVIAAIIEHLKLKTFDIVGINYQGFQPQVALLPMLSLGFLPVVTAGTHTLEIDLSLSLGDIWRAMQGRWRDEIKRARNNPSLETVFIDDPALRLKAFDAFIPMYENLKNVKGFRNSLKSLAYRDLAAEDRNILFMEVREAGEPILVRMVHCAPTRWTDFFVASNEAAKTTGANRLAIWRLIEHAREKKCPVLDLGGIDPAGNPGVYEFKRGLTSNAVASNPLWLFSRNALLRKSFAAFLTCR